MKKYSVSSCMLRTTKTNWNSKVIMEVFIKSNPLKTRCTSLWLLTHDVLRHVKTYILNEMKHNIKPWGSSLYQLTPPPTESYTGLSKWSLQTEDGFRESGLEASATRGQSWTTPVWFASRADRRMTSACSVCTGKHLGSSYPGFVKNSGPLPWLGESTTFAHLCPRAERQEPAQDMQIRNLSLLCANTLLHVHTLAERWSSGVTGRPAGRGTIKMKDELLNYIQFYLSGSPSISLQNQY